MDLIAVTKTYLTKIGKDPVKDLNKDFMAKAIIELDAYEPVDIVNFRPTGTNWDLGMIQAIVLNRKKRGVELTEAEQELMKEIDAKDSSLKEHMEKYKKKAEAQKDNEQETE